MRLIEYFARRGRISQRHFNYKLKSRHCSEETIQKVMRIVSCICKIIWTADEPDRRYFVLHANLRDRYFHNSTTDAAPPGTSEQTLV